MHGRYPEQYTADYKECIDWMKSAYNWGDGDWCQAIEYLAKANYNQGLANGQAERVQRKDGS